MTTKNITLRLSHAELAALDAYAEREGILRMQCLRIALGRLYAKKTTTKERDASARSPGNPIMIGGGKAASRLGAKAARARHEGV
jgi:hypothetical protein